MRKLLLAAIAAVCFNAPAAAVQLVMLPGDVYNGFVLGKTYTTFDLVYHTGEPYKPPLPFTVLFEADTKIDPADCITYGYADCASRHVSTVSQFAASRFDTKSYMSLADQLRPGELLFDGKVRVENISNGYFALYVGLPGLPEPSTWAAMILGFGLIGSALRRRQVCAPDILKKV